MQIYLSVITLFFRVRHGLQLGDGLQLQGRRHVDTGRGRGLERREL